MPYAVHRVVIEVRPSLGSRQLLLGNATASSLKLTSSRVCVFAGLLSRTMRVIRSDGVSPNALVLSPGCAMKLGLRSGDVVRVLIKGSQLRIGPYVGVLTAPTKVRTSARRRYGRDTEYLREVCAAGTRMDLVAFVFSYDAVNISNGRLIGWLPEPQRYGRWHPREFPLPNVVFNRIPTRGQERSKRARQLIGYATQHKSMRLFNKGFMDKWSVYKDLSQHSGVKHMVPTTAVFRGLPMLKSWLRRHRSVYLKPSSGSLGEGIVVVRLTIRGITCRYRNERKRPVTEYARSVEAVYSRIKRIIARRRYLIQPDLNLLTVDGTPFDVRLLMQRSSRGKWCRTKMFARVARRGEYTSNISRGGSGVPLDKLLVRIAPRKAQHVLQAVRRAGVTVAQAVESLAETPVGELGIDIGIDRALNLWLIEVNSKPHVDVVKPSTTERARDASVRRPMEFATYLHKTTL